MTLRHQVENALIDKMLIQCFHQYAFQASNVDNQCYLILTHMQLVLYVCIYLYLLLIKLLYFVCG